MGVLFILGFASWAWTLLLEQGASTGLVVATIMLTLSLPLGVAETLEAIRRRRRASVDGLHLPAQRQSRTPVEDLTESPVMEGALSVYAVTLLPLLEATEDIGEILVGFLLRVGQQRLWRQLTPMSQALQDTLGPGEPLQAVATAVMYKPGWRILNIWRFKSVLLAVTSERLLCFRTRRGNLASGPPMVEDRLGGILVLEWYKGIGSDRFNYVLVLQDSSGVKRRFDFAPAFWTQGRTVYERLTAPR